MLPFPYSSFKKKKYGWRVFLLYNKLCICENENSSVQKAESTLALCIIRSFWVPRKALNRKKMLTCYWWEERKYNWAVKLWIKSNSLCPNVPNVRYTRQSELTDQSCFAYTLIWIVNKTEIEEVSKMNSFFEDSYITNVERWRDDNNEKKIKSMKVQCTKWSFCRYFNKTVKFKGFWQNLYWSIIILYICVHCSSNVWVLHGVYWYFTSEET